MSCPPHYITSITDIVISCMNLVKYRDYKSAFLYCSHDQSYKAREAKFYFVINYFMNETEVGIS